MNPSLLAIALVAALGAGIVSGQDYPSKPIRFYAGPAGGANDFAARAAAQGIAAPLGQPVVIDNRPTIIGRELGAKAPPDGYTLTVAGGGLWILPLLQRVSYDAMKDFAPISQLARDISVLAVHPSVPAKTVKELIALAKARPGELHDGTVPSGSANHLGQILFKSMAGVNMVSVPYKGSPQRITGVVTGEVQMTMADPNQILPLAKSGRLRALAVTSGKPSALAPGLPPIGDTLPGYDMVGITVIFAPAKTPGAIVSRLNQEIVRSLNMPDVKERFLNSGFEAVTSSPDELAATIKSQIATIGKMITDFNIKVAQ